MRSIVKVGKTVFAGAACLPQGILAESLRRKKEREKRLAGYQNRPKVEAEGKGGRLTGGQIAKAWQTAKNNFKARLQKAQAMGMSEAEADQLLKQVNTTGKIGASLGAAEGYIAQKEQEWAERIEAYRAWRVEEATYIPRPNPRPICSPACRRSTKAGRPGKWKQPKSQAGSGRGMGSQRPRRMW